MGVDIGETMAALGLLSLDDEDVRAVIKSFKFLPVIEEISLTVFVEDGRMVTFFMPVSILSSFDLAVDDRVVIWFGEYPSFPFYPKAVWLQAANLVVWKEKDNLWGRGSYE